MTVRTARKLVSRALFTFSAMALCALWPESAFAQASIAGVVRDSSGAVLPGVTVEASSDALIEKVRSVVTDGSGQYKVIDLRPGTYAVTFTLTGFSVVKREGIELTGSFSATVNADMAVGTLNETITVTSETPIVDVQSATRQQTLNNEVIGAIPGAKIYTAIMALVPGITASGTNDVGGISGPLVVTFAVHGGRGNEGRLQVDGIGVGAALNGSGTGYYVSDIGNAQEVTVSTSGGLGESEVGGPYMNVVPKQGGNVFRGSFFANGANEAMGGNNLNPALTAAGARTGNTLLKIWDVNGVFGGPIVKERLWFFGGARHQGNRKQVAGMFSNAYAGDPTRWTYLAVPGQPARDDGTWKSTHLRLTWQATPRNKIGIFWDRQSTCTSCISGGNATTSPEAAGTGDGIPLDVQQVTWNSPMTNRLLLEAGAGTYLTTWGGRERPGNPTHDLVRVVEQCSAGCPANGNIPGLTYRSMNWASNYNGAWSWHSSASYVTGAHSMKAGYNGNYYNHETQNFQNTTSLQYRVNNGVPNQLTELGFNGVRTKSHTALAAFYVQDQSTFGRLTVQAAVRFDRAWSWFPEQTVGPNRFFPTPIVFAETKGVASYNDITPRLGAAYDIFGTGRTSLRVNLGKYLEAATNGVNYTANNPTSRIVQSVTRTWTDANGNFTPDCNLLNNQAQDLRATGGDFCGGVSNAAFGTRQVSASSLDPALFSGWGVRPSDWSLGVSVQQQVVPRMSVEVGYYRRWFSGFTVTNNRATTASDYSAFSFTAPQDPRLPNGGGYTVSGLYDVNPNVASLVDNLLTSSSNFGNQYQRFNGVDVNLNVRIRQGLTFQGGTSTGQTVTDNCEVRAKVPELGVVNPYCHSATGFRTQLRFLATYLVPKIGVQASATLQSNPGGSLVANYSVPTAVAQQTLGRPLSLNAPNATVNLLPPGTLFGDRINVLDLRFAKILDIGGRKLNFGFDLYNSLNSSAIQTYNATFVPGAAVWPAPTLILPARFAKVSAQFDF